MNTSQLLRKSGIVISIPTSALWLYDGCFANANGPLQNTSSNAGLTSKQYRDNTNRFKEAIKFSRQFIENNRSVYEK